MLSNQFASVAVRESHPKWQSLTERYGNLYSRPDDVRNPFTRDYTRILHSMAYRRLKHKTQVFFNIENDHICTRIEHVQHVESVSSSIAKAIGLNEELTRAIAIGHDIGHAPFGHQGERVINHLSKKYLKNDFWHEHNGLRFADKIELLEDNYKISRNLHLTYAVRDGIISHCGEIDENGIRPREELIILDEFSRPGEHQPATWEGCVVKIADKIAYIGRDIEDAINLGFLEQTEQNKLLQMARIYDQQVMNTTVIMHNMIIDICKNSSPEKGITLSPQLFNQMNELKRFNYEYIYKNKRLVPFQCYSELIINQLFETLLGCYEEKHTLKPLSDMRSHAPTLISSFLKWLAQYCDSSIVEDTSLKTRSLQCENEKIYGKLETKKIYAQAILDYISGMTDRFAIKVFNELISY